LLAWAGGIIGLFTALSGIFDRLVPWLISRLTGAQQLTTGWIAGDHWGSKAITSLLVVAFFYLIVFSFQATVLLGERESPALAASATPPDFRAEFARAIGVNFSSVRDYYDVHSKLGDCRVILSADFAVDHLPISHIERKFSSSSATSRKQAGLEAQVNPPKTKPMPSVKTVGNETTYHFRFSPPLADPPVTCQTKITEDLTNGVWMFGDQVPESEILGGKFEAIGHLVQEPTSQLELEIRFPYDYLVRGDQYCRVRLGSTETAHQKEELRLKIENALDPPRVIDGRQVLKLVVKNPLMGLCYFLAWVAPERDPFKDPHKNPTTP
jgi:hypothetical protein